MTPVRRRAPREYWWLVAADLAFYVVGFVLLVTGQPMGVVMMALGFALGLMVSSTIMLQVVRRIEDGR